MKKDTTTNKLQDTPTDESKLQDLSSMLKFSISQNSLPDNPKAYTHGFEHVSIETIYDLVDIANRYSISAPSYKDNHRAASNINEGGNFILIDCDAPGQADVDFTQSFHPFHFYVSTFFTNETDW